MKTTPKLPNVLAVAPLASLLATAAYAANITINPSNAPPTGLGSVVISNGVPPYYTPAHGSDFGAGSNVGEKSTDNGSDGFYTFIADDKAVVGQSFLTGPNAAGYKVVAVSLQAVMYGGNAASASGTFSWVPSVNYVVRITKPASTNDTANSLAVLATETAEQGVDWTDCSTCNIPSLNSGAAKGAGCGRWITFTLATPVTLLPNTLYGFDVGLNTDSTDNTISRHSFYWETYGRGYTPATGFAPVDLYVNGRAYGSGAGGRGNLGLTNLWGDRSFEVFLEPASTVVAPRITTELLVGGGKVTNQPLSGTFYSGSTATFRAKAAGDTNLVYQWRMNGTNISNGTKYNMALISPNNGASPAVPGPTISVLSVSNVTPADSGSSFTLVVTNTAGAVTSAPAILTVIAAPTPTAGTYAYTIYTNKPIAYYRFNELVNPATNPATFDYVGGGVGRWETNAVRTNGPTPTSFNGFETNNYGTQSRTNIVNANSNWCWSTLAPLNLYTNTVTFTAWIYPNGSPGVQGGQYSGLFSTRAGSTECGIQVGDSGTTPNGTGKLAYTWNDGEIRSFPSGYTIPANMWSFIALVITPTNGTMYFAQAGGALGSTANTQWHDVENWTGNWQVGFDNRWQNGEYTFNGIVDEVAVWNRSLSLNEITNIYAAAYKSPPTNTAPPLTITCSTNKTVECGSAWDFDAPSASGGCGTATNITITGTITNGACPQVITRTWQATDGCSGSVSCSQTVTVVDTTPPSITCSSNKTVECGSVWTFDVPSASDSCSGTNVTVIVTGTITNGSGCSLAITRTWQASDACSNTASCSQTVTVVDTTPPVLTCASNKTVQCGSAWTFDPPSASDVCCGANVTITVTGTITNGTGCSLMITRTWQAMDCCSNTASCSQTVTVVDTTPPVITCSSNKTVQCGSAWNFDAPSASDTCCGTNVTIAVTGTITNGTACSLTITRTWQAMDCCTNSASCSQTVTVVDTTPPVITCASNKTVQCGSVWSFDVPSVSDTCCGTNVTIGVTGTITNGTACSLVITRTWQATDCCTNSASCSQTVTVVDTTPPVITCASNKTVQCGSVWSFDVPAASDACASTNVTVIVLSTITNGTDCTQTITRTWQATDPCTNINTCTQTVTVVKPDCVPVQIEDVNYTGSTLTMSFQSLSCLIYDCEYTDSLAGTSWTTFQTVVGTGNSITVQDTFATPNQRFYRIVCRCH